MTTAVLILDELLHIFHQNTSREHLELTEDEEDETEHDKRLSIIDIILSDKLTQLSVEQSHKLREDGYCMIDDPLNENIAIGITGYIRQIADDNQLMKDLIREIVYYYGSRFNREMFIELIICGETNMNREYALVPRVCLELSGKLSNEIENNRYKIDIDDIEMESQIPSDIAHHVLRYLGHHLGVQPDPLPCPVRSIHMFQIVSDRWDAAFIDVFEKKTIFEIILAANCLGITSLLHLGCAKIATMIKQMDQKEINRVIEEEETYRRDNATQNNDDNNGDNDNGNGNDDGDIKSDDESENEETTDLDQIPSLDQQSSCLVRSYSQDT